MNFLPNNCIFLVNLTGFDLCGPSWILIDLVTSIVELMPDSLLWCILDFSGHY